MSAATVFAPEFADEATEALAELGATVEEKAASLVRLGVTGHCEDPAGCVLFAYLTRAKGLPVAGVFPGYHQLILGRRVYVPGKVEFWAVGTGAGAHVPQPLVLSPVDDELAQLFDAGDLPQLEAVVA